MNIVLSILKLLNNPKLMKMISYFLKINNKQFLSQLIGSPSSLFTQISKLPKSKLKMIEKIINTSNPAKELGKMNTQSRKAAAKILGETQDKVSETVRMSSSWIVQCNWTPTNADGSAGEMILWTKNSPIGYAYPGVSYRVWTAMKNAKGQNGSGAGTVFWALYLRRFKGSSQYKYLQKLKKLASGAMRI